MLGRLRRYRLKVMLPGALRDRKSLIFRVTIRVRSEPLCPDVTTSLLPPTSMERAGALRRASARLLGSQAQRYVAQSDWLLM